MPNNIKSQKSNKLDMNKTLLENNIKQGSQVLLITESGIEKSNLSK